MNILITGITGYVGSVVAARLRSDGHTVRGFSRRTPGAGIDVPVVSGDAVSGEGLAEALEGIDAAYFLIHSMEHSINGVFSTREQAAAENFAREANAAGVKRIIYLGGLIPEGGPASDHLASRLRVEQILLEASPCSVSLRASIVIGARSRPFRFLVKLVERLPVLVVPGWQTYRTSPIDERDMVELLAGAATSDQLCGQAADIGGRDIVSYGELIDRIRDHMLVGRPTLSFNRINATPIASRISALITEEEYDLIGPLMESLERDLLPRDNRAAELLGVRLHSLDAAIEHALRDWESMEPLRAR